MTTLLARLFGRPATDTQENPMTTETTTDDKPAASVLMRFLTVGGATVELRSLRFTTRYTWKGRPYVSDEAHEVDGSTWSCLGCGADAQTDGRSYARFDYGRYLPNESGESREDANGHAEKCRAMPRPTT